MDQPAPNFRIIASLPVYGDPARMYRLAYNGDDGGNVALVEAAEGAQAAETVIGPYTMAQILAHAERVLAGEPRTVTKPDSAKVLALGLLTFLRLLSEPQPGTSPASKGLTDREPSEPSPPEVPPGMADAEGEGGHAVLSSPTGAPADQPSLFGRAPLSSCTECGG